MLDNQSTTTNSSTTSSTKESETNNPLLTTFAVMTIILSLVTGFLIWQNIELNKILSKQLVSNNPQPTPLPTTTSDPAVDWLSYTDRENRYFFKYPSSYQLTEKNQTIILNGPESCESLPPEANLCFDDLITIQVHSNPQLDSSIVWLEKSQAGGGLKFVKQAEVNLAGGTAILAIPQNTEGYAVKYILAHQKQVFEITVHSGVKKDMLTSFLANFSLAGE